MSADFAALNLAYVLLLAAAFCGSLNRVRTLLVLAATSFVLYGAIQAISSMVVWNLVIGGLNFQRLMTGLWSEAAVRLTPEQETVRGRFFRNVAPADFLKLWTLGEDVRYVDDLIVTAGSTPDRLHLVLRGTVRVKQDGAVLAVLGSGSVIGHVEPRPFSSPSADWEALGAVWLRSWRLSDLAGQHLPRQIFRSVSGDNRPLVGAGAGP